MKKSIAFDFDGVIHSYTSGWQGYDVIPDPVVPGIAEVIKRLRDLGYSIVVLSSRAATEDGKAAIRNYLFENAIEVDKITDQKVPSIVLVDDRAICFRGDTSTLVEDIIDFTPGPLKELSVEALAIELHEAGRKAVEEGLTVNPTGKFLEWNEITEQAREGRRVQARYLLENYSIVSK